MDAYERIGRGGLPVGTAAMLGLGWGLYALDPDTWPGLTGAFVQTAVLLGNVVLTVCSPRTKVALVRLVQRYLLNPVVRGLYALGLNPLGLAVLETRGRTTGRPRRVPVGNGRDGGDGVDFWIVAEHGLRANYVRNVLADPHVRVRVRVGLRYRWIPGIATVLPGDDPLARQRRICRWHPLRILNAANVRVLGADLVTVHVRLHGVVARPARVEVAA